MCGIVGAVAQRNIVPILVEGLRRLEYRGYDSCGLAVHVDGELKRLRSVSRVADLREAGYAFESQTDSEVIAHLIDHVYQGDLFEAVQTAVRKLQGAYAIAA